MRAVVQRVSEASVVVGGEVAGRIGRGLLVLVGVEAGDSRSDAEWLAAKIVALRLVEAGGEALVVSQFTLHASTKRGNRPSFVRAAQPDEAVPLYEWFVAEIERGQGRPVARGVFAADMQVALVNDGPVTIIIDSRSRE
jgi:D-tyrosyl-tRNA(Tyr) deacylase